MLPKNLWIKLRLTFKKTICKPRHWNLGTGIGIGTDITNAIISSPIRPMDPKITGWWLRIRGPHPQSDVHFEVVVTCQIKKVISLLSQGLWTPNLAEWNPSNKSRDTSNTWSRDKSKTLYFHFTRPVDPKPSRVVT